MRFPIPFTWVPASPFRLRRRIGPRPAFLGSDATAKVVGAAPVVEPKRRSHSLLETARIRQNTLPPDEPYIVRMKVTMPSGLAVFFWQVLALGKGV